MRKLLVTLLLVCLLPAAALGDANAYLTGADLKALEPAYETFLNALADLLIEKQLLTEPEREDWLLYQLGDFVQNGGYGTIQAMYTPGLLNMADESVTMQRFALNTPAGLLTLDTLRRYSPAYSSLPGLPLDTELNDAATGEPVPCRFRWTTTGGMLLIWDGNEIVEVGSTFVSDGRPLYWYENPEDGYDETLRLELLSASEDVIMASAELYLTAAEDCWLAEDMK